MTHKLRKLLNLLKCIYWWLNCYHTSLSFFFFSRYCIKRLIELPFTLFTLCHSFPLRYSMVISMGYLTACQVSRVFIFNYGIPSTDFSGWGKSEAFLSLSSLPHLLCDSTLWRHLRFRYVISFHPWWYQLTHRLPQPCVHIKQLKKKKIAAALFTVDAAQLRLLSASHFNWKCLFFYVWLYFIKRQLTLLASVFSSSYFALFHCGLICWQPHLDSMWL